MSSNVTKTVSVMMLISIISVLLTGCWDRIELEDRALILGLAIDEAEAGADRMEDNVNHMKESELPPNERMIRITAQISVPGRIPLGPGEMGGGGGSQDEQPVWIVSVFGHTIDDAMNNLQQQISDPSFLIHLRVIIISEAIAKRGLDNLNDYFRRNPEIRRSTWLIVSEGEAAEIVKVSPPLERVPTLYVLAMMERSVDMGKFPRNNIGVFWSSQSKWGQHAFLPYVGVRQKENIIIRGLALFRNNKMIRITEPFQIGVYMAAKGLDPGGYTGLYRVPDIGFVMVQTKKRSTKISVSMENEMPKVTLQIRLQAQFDEKYSGHASISTDDQLLQVEKEFEKLVTDAIESLIRETQKVKTDIFGFGEYLRANHRAYWNRNISSKEDWENMYGKLQIEVNTQAAIRRVGMKIE